MRDKLPGKDCLLDLLVEIGAVFCCDFIIIVEVLPIEKEDGERAQVPRGRAGEQTRDGSTARVVVEARNGSIASTPEVQDRKAGDSRERIEQSHQCLH